MSVPPADFARWGLHCFCLGATRTPQAVVRMDDNGRLLWRARGGAGRAGLGGCDSQVALLEAFGLLAREGEEWRTTFPAVAAGPLRARAAAVVAAVAGRLAADFAAIARALAGEGFAASTHAVQFGLLLDGAFWNALAARGALPPTAPDADHPHWRGVFWATWPPREGAAGLNLAAGRALRLSMVWTEVTAAALAALAGLPAVRAALDMPPPSGCGPITAGGLRLPLVRPGGPVAQAAARGGATLAAWFLAEAPALSAAFLPPDIAGDAARVILGHEVIWALADALCPPPPGSAADAVFVEPLGRAPGGR